MHVNLLALLAPPPQQGRLFALLTSGQLPSFAAPPVSSSWECKACWTPLIDPQGSNSSHHQRHPFQPTR
eukprot:scaffold252226_cov12-Tisochrysis_lutea.AAC.1